jgi:hypothetical protein
MLPETFGLGLILALAVPRAVMVVPLICAVVLRKPPPTAGVIAEATGLLVVESLAAPELVAVACGATVS